MVARGTLFALLSTLSRAKALFVLRVNAALKGRSSTVVPVAGGASAVDPSSGDSRLLWLRVGSLFDGTRDYVIRGEKMRGAKKPPFEIAISK